MFRCRLEGKEEAKACSPAKAPQMSLSAVEHRAPLMAGRMAGVWAWMSSSFHPESCRCLHGHRDAGLEEGEVATPQGLQGAHACEVSGPWTALCPQGVGWDMSPPPAILNKASGSVAPESVLRSPSCGGEKGSVASSAASPLFPAFRLACAWLPAGKAVLMMVGVLRCYWIAVSDSYVCGKNKSNYYLQIFLRKTITTTKKKKHHCGM